MLPLHVQADDPIYTLYVDGAPPTAQMSPFYEYNGSISRIDDASWKIQLAGSLSDPNLSGTGVVGSGVVTNTVLV